MAEQAVWQIKRLALTIPVPSVAAIRTRAWMLGPPLLLGLLAALIAVMVQGTAWRAKAEVSFNVLNLANAVTNPPTSVAGDSLVVPGRYMQTQAKLARSPELAARVVRAARVLGLTATEFLRHSSAKLVSDADILSLSVSYRQRALAVRLTNAYANQFLRFKTEWDTQGVREVLRKVQARINELRARGMAGSPVYEVLIQQRQQLEAIAVQFRSNASVFKRADGASSFRPHALRNGLIGGALGALLGVALVVGVDLRRRRT